MSSVTFSVSRELVTTPSTRTPARVTASAAAKEALGLLGPAEFRRVARSSDASHEPADDGLAATASALIDTVGRFPWRKALLVFVGLSAITACAVPAVVFLARPRPPCELHEVRGRVVFGKTVPAGARITLTPREGIWPYDAFPTATVAADGSFRFGTFGREDGVPAGTYVATVQWFRVAPDGAVGGNVLPKKYASASTSPLTVSVASGPHDLPPLQITR